MVVVVSLEHQASQEREDRKERPANQGCLCQVPRDVQDLLVPRVHLDFPDRQASAQRDKTALQESPAVPVCRGREVIQERLARKVRRATPV